MPSSGGHHCSVCNRSNDTRCITKGHLAPCTSGKCLEMGQYFQVSKGCSLHPYNKGFNADKKKYANIDMTAGQTADEALTAHDAARATPEGGHQKAKNISSEAVIKGRDFIKSISSIRDRMKREVVKARWTKENPDLAKACGQNNLKGHLTPDLATLSDATNSVAINISAEEAQTRAAAAEERRTKGKVKLIKPIGNEYYYQYRAQEIAEQGSANEAVTLSTNAIAMGPIAQPTKRGTKRFDKRKKTHAIPQ